MENRVLVTGASGFVGRTVVKELLSQGALVLALDQLQYNFNDSRVLFSKANLLDKDTLSKDINAFKPTSVIHLAAIASPTYGNVGELYDINVHGTENILDILQEICEDGTRVVLASTAGVYGNSGKDYITEDTSFNPQNHYSFSKMITEYISKSYLDKLDIKIIRPFNMIGVGQNESFLVPKLVKAFVYKQPILSVGNIETYRDFVDIDFASKIFCKVVLDKEMRENVLNICAGYGTRGSDILEMLQELTGYSPKIQVNPQFLRKNEIMRLVGDPTKCNQFIGPNLQTKSVRNILEEMIRAYQKKVNSDE